MYSWVTVMNPVLRFHNTIIFIRRKIYETRRKNHIVSIANIDSLTKTAYLKEDCKQNSLELIDKH